MYELLESYINGNISYVNKRLDTAEFTRVEFFDFYEELHKPDIHDIKLFIARIMA